MLSSEVPSPAQRPASMSQRRPHCHKATMKNRGALNGSTEKGFLEVGTEFPRRAIQHEGDILPLWSWVPGVGFKLPGLGRPFRHSRSRFTQSTWKRVSPPQSVHWSAPLHAVILAKLFMQQNTMSLPVWESLSSYQNAHLRLL